MNMITGVSFPMTTDNSADLKDKSRNIISKKLQNSKI